MRTLYSRDIIDPVKQLCIRCNFRLDPQTVKFLKRAKLLEKSELGLYVLGEILDNKDIAAEKEMPLCQDTGVAVFFVRWGQECVLKGASVQQVFDQAVREAYKEAYLRKSMLKDPLFDRNNTKDNTPAVVHLELVPGNKVEVSYLAKGAGADNSSQLAMLTPADVPEGIKEFVLKVCREAGASSCPPWILGIGVGGTFDSVAALAKKALLRDLGSKHKQKPYQKLEKEFFTAVNKLGIGPQGLGGRITALGVFIESAPCHAASLPVAVNIQCHSNRKGVVII
ncbi:MAG: fumarate hydratase [bacterium]|nr:fumarate hydratase [bacterium]